MKGGFTRKHKRCAVLLGTGLGLVLLPSLHACGGTAPNAAPAAVPGSTAEEIPSSEQPISAEPTPEPVDACADGNCSHCGQAVCLAGFYCDEGASACAWLPQCAATPGCECLQRQLPECTCEEREGSAFVKCP
jgi:hypothetical protein